MKELKKFSMRSGWIYCGTTCICNQLLAQKGKLLLPAICYRALENNSGGLSKAVIRHLQNTQKGCRYFHDCTLWETK